MFFVTMPLNRVTWIDSVNFAVLTLCCQNYLARTSSDWVLIEQERQRPSLKDGHRRLSITSTKEVQEPNFEVKNVKATAYIAQCPILRTVQSALHFTSLTDLFTQTPSRLLWEASSHMLQLMREGCAYTYPPLSIARYSFIQLSELEQCRVKRLAQGFNTAAQDSNQGSRNRESEALPWHST